jgi:ribosomal subunit interface protein
MRYALKGTNIDLTDEIRSYIDAKLRGFDGLLAAPEAARVDIELQYLLNEERTYRAEMTLHDPGAQAPARAEARGHALHEAIDKAVQELFEELTRAKRKKRGLFRRSAVRVKEYLRGWRRQP